MILLRSFIKHIMHLSWMVLFVYALVSQDGGGKDLLHSFDSYPNVWAVFCGYVHFYHHLICQNFVITI